MNKVPYHLCFDTLANQLRIEIMKELEQGSKSVQELADTLKEEQSKVSHSLRMLRECKYVDVEKKGKKRIYSLKKGFDRKKLKMNPMDGTGVIGFVENHAECVCTDCKKLEKGGLR